jgi:hypothetical protein
MDGTHCADDSWCVDAVCQNTKLAARSRDGLRWAGIH